MDDQNFTEFDAKQWIRAIEDKNARARENDIYPLLKNWVSKNNLQRILDIGCGQGVCSAEIDLSDSHYVGVDPSPVLIERAKELYSNAKRDFKVGNAYAIPYPDKHFDAVFSVALLHLLEHLDGALNEFSRVLNFGGSLLIITADPDCYSAWTDSYQHKHQEGKRFSGRNLQDGKTVEDVLHLHSLDEIKNALHSSGFTILDTEKFRNQLAIIGRKNKP